MSGVTATDWTRNLSLHFASVAGSSFRACNRTIKRISSSSQVLAQREGKRTLDLDGTTGLDTAGVRAHTVAKRKLDLEDWTKIARSIFKGYILLGGSGFDLKGGKETESAVFVPDKCRGAGNVGIP